MSGRKCSAVEIVAAEQRRRLALVAEIEAAQRAVLGILRQLTDMLPQASPGQRRSCAEEECAARAWLQRTESDPNMVASWSIEASQAALTAAQVHLQKLADEGRATWVRLLEAVHHHARAAQQTAELRLRGEAELAALAMQLDGGSILLQRWFDPPEEAALQEALAALRETLHAERFQELPAPMEELRGRIHERLAHAEQQEALHQRRLYLLKGLRQVCRDLRFAEVGTQHYETPGDRRSRIVFTVDTRDHGRVTFHLALDSLSADACLAPTHCADEFNRISTLLKQKFGVQTAFHTADEPSLPLARNSRELDEPDDGETREESRHA